MDVVTAPMSRLYDLLIQTKNKPHPNSIYHTQFRKYIMKFQKNQTK